MPFARGKRLSRFSHYTFDAGENKGQAPSFLSKSELDRSLNVELRANGISTRYGSQILTTTAGLPTPIAGNPRIRDGVSLIYGSSDTDLFTAGTDLYRDVTTPVSLRTGLSNTARTTFEVVNEIVYGANGVDPIYYLDPNRSVATAYTAGYTTPPAFTATPALVGGAMATGTYSYYVTWYDENTETESNIQSAEVTAGVTGPTGRVDLSNLPIDPENRTSHWIIYRKDPLGFYHYQIAKIAYTPGTPTHTDTLAQTGTSFIAPDDNDRPDPSQVVIKYQNVMVYMQGSLVSWSKPFRYQNVPTFNREILDDSSADIQAAAVHRDTLVIWKTDSIYTFSGDLSGGNYLVKKIASVGTRSPRSIAVSPDGIFFFDSFKKPRFINSTDFQQDDLRDSTDISFKYKKKFDTILVSDLEVIQGLIWETSEVTQYRLFVPSELYKPGTFNNHCFIYDYGLGRRNGGQSAWFDFEYSVNLSCVFVHTGTDRAKRLYAGDDYGLMWELEYTSRYDDGTSQMRAETIGVVTYGANTVDCSLLTMTVNAHVGQQLIIYDTYRYTEVFRSRITANTATQFTVEDAVPAGVPADPFVSCGGYLWYFGTSNFTHDRAGRNHSWKMSILFSLNFIQSECQVFTHYDFNQVFNYTYDYINNPANQSLSPLADNYLITASSGLPRYDISRYGAAVYGIAIYGTDEFLLNGKYPWNHVSWGLVCRAPQNPFEYLGGTLYYRPGGLLT